MPNRLNRQTGSAIVADRERPILLDSGSVLHRVDVAYETYGEYRGGNAILVCHAVTGSAHAAGTNKNVKRGWWDSLIGPGKALDTDNYFVISSNVLGGCYGTTGPCSISSETGLPYQGAFPEISIRDMVHVQRRLLDALGVGRLHAVVGGSMGGMQALEWGLLYPDDVDVLAPIASCAAHSPWRIGIGAVAREAIRLAERTGDIEAGLRLARKISVLTYRSAEEFDQRFGRQPARDRGFFAVEEYLERHADAIVNRFDAGTYLALFSAMDRHDLGRDRGGTHAALAHIQQPTLCVGISTDMLYPATEQRELAAYIPNAQYREIQSIYGHDAFLIESEQLGRYIQEFLADNRIGHKAKTDSLYATA